MNLENDITNLIKVPTFDYTLYEENCGHEWQNWFRSFEWYLRGNHIEDDNEKFVKLMFLAGRKIQELYESLPENENKVNRGPLIEEYVLQLTEYENAVAKLNNFFLPKTNSTFERHMLRQLHQEKSEKIDIFVMRLRRQAERCNFGNTIEENIKDQIIEKCNSTKLRRTLLKVGDGDLKEVIKAAKLFESISEQEQTFGSTHKPEYVNAIKFESDLQSKGQIIECNSCGFSGHRAFDDKCPAKGKTCNKCGGLNHFSRRCHSRKRTYPEQMGDSQNENKRKIQDIPIDYKHREPVKFKQENRETIKYIQEDDGYVF